MTHQNHQTNGASLEDCHTNFFALADLCGIKWKKLVLNERPHASGDPLDDPVLKSYTKCLAKDILCVWRRVSQHKSDLDLTGALGVFDISQIGAASVTHPPLSLTAAKELWIFWYGEEPDLTDLVSPELLKSSDSVEQGSWESGLSYECRSLLFKALHNLIERCLLSRDIIRIGKWFVQPSLEKNQEKSSPHLSFSFAFFVHGESTVCASMDIREHPPIRPLTEEYLNEVIKNTQQNIENCSPNDEDEKEDFNNDINHNNVSMQSVILAPFGLSAVLTGNRSESCEQFADKIMNDWNNFYPMKDSDNSSSQSKLPQLVEVNSGGIKMWYPSKYVLLTDLDLNNKQQKEIKSDTKCSENHNSNNISNNNIKNKKISGNNNENVNSSNNNSAVNCETMKPYRFSEIEKEYIESSVSNFCDGIQKSAAGVLPERAWQDSIMNPAYTEGTSTVVTSEHKVDKIESAQSENNIENSINVANGIESSSSRSNTMADTANTWNFIDPTLIKTTCGCSRCKNLENCGSFFSSKGSSTSSSSLSGKSNFRINSFRIRTPFHKRSDTSKLGSKNSKDRCFSNQPSTSSKFNIRSSCKNSGGQNSALTNETSQQMSIGSVGSIQSPMHHNLSVHSQPSSVLVNEQNILSPIPPSDISPPTMTPLSDNNIDQKSDLQTSSNNNEKRMDNSQPSTQVDGVETNMRNEFKTGGSEKQNETQTKENSNLKRPLLKTLDCENILEEDLTTCLTLYDYSTYDAWMNHPIKRFKPDELRNNSIRMSYPKSDIYAGQQCSGDSSNSQQTYNPIIKQEMWKGDESTATKNPLSCGSGKEGKADVDGDKTIDNLFTSAGLEPSYADLNKIFDNSDDNSNDDHMVDNTPPGSNNSIAHPEMELSDGNDTKRDKMTFGNFGTLSNSGLTALISGNNNMNALGSIRNEELSKMFPTPPSIEQHTNSSPGGICGNNSDNLMESNELSIANARSENYQNLGSPAEETIDDYSYVFIPPKIAPVYGSSKYSPLTNLLSQSTSAITLPPNSSYVPSWVKQKQEQEEARKKQLEEKMDPKKVLQVPPAMNSTDNLIPPNEIKKEIKTEVMSPMTKPVPMTSPFGGPRSIKNDSNNSIINRLLSSPSPAAAIKNQVLTPMASPLVANLQGNFNSPYGQDAMFRNQRLPIPLHPPPPYDAAVNSPSLNTNLHGDDISNNNKKLISNKNLYSRNAQQMGQKAPEANSLLVNVLLYDTSLNIFRDHNFDSCTICVCNATQNSVGNIRGLDSGIYLSLASSCHFNENSSAIVEKSSEGKSTCPKRDQCGGIKYFGNNRNLINQQSNDSPRSISTVSPCMPSSVSCSSSSCCSTNSSTDENQLQCVNVVDLMLNGYQDDDVINCRCGFSSVVNRRLAHRTGLFFEDEMEITGIANDPSCYKKRSLLSLLMKQNKKLTQGDEGDNNTKGPSNNKQDNLGKDNSKDEFSFTQLGPIFDLLRSQCTLLQNSSNSVQRTIKHLNQDKYSPMIANRHVNILEFIDAFDIVTLALEQGRFAFEKFDGYNNRLSYMPNQQQKKYSEKRVVTSQAISVHKWPFINAAGPKSNQDIIRVMKSMKVLLQKAFNQNGTTGLWDAPYAVKGPLTWREFHRLAGRGIGQCEPQPIPSIVVGHDKEWLCISPYALQFWDKLLLEPYSQPKDIAYIVITPDNSFITSKVKTFFKELSTTYEMCRLGRHQPVKRWDGILRVGKTVPVSSNNSLDDEWLQTVDTNKLNELLRLYGHTLQEQLAPFLSKASQDKSLLFPEAKEHQNHHSRSASSSMPSPMLPPHTPESHNNGNNSSSSERGPNTPKSDLDDTKDNLNTSGGMLDSLGHQYDIAGNPPHIVIYIIEPFTSGTDSTSLERIACLSLLKYYSNLLNAIPESIKTNISVQIVAQESIMELGKNRDINRWSDHMRNFALNVFTQSHRYLAHTHNVKSLTGFGTAANGDLFIKSKDEKNRAPVKLYTPPYILSSRNAKSENNENFGQSGIEQQCSSIMYCCYCLSEDQSMLMAVVTDERGEFLENCTINIDVPNRKRRKKTSARRIGLQKLMDFILGVMSQTVKPWRLVIGRIGRIGHGELKGWSWLLSRPNLIKASKHLKDICKQCSYMYPQSVPSIWSACLVTLEPDSNFRVMADQFTPDERFSQRSTQSPLSTPQDVTCTHILVFPTSAILQSSQATFHEQHFESALDFGEDIFMPGEGEDVDEEFNGISHLFDDWNESAVGGLPPESPTNREHHDSPMDQMDDSRNRPSPGLTDNQCGPSRNLYSYPETEEVGQLLQQPLALGYLVSTAPTGRMPSWFWECCPHLETVCPVFLKTSLHIHSPSIHKENDDVYYKEQSSKIEHPLDSNTTADVLRYVLEGYNVLSWLAMDSNTHDRLSCLPIHVQMLMQLYHLHTALA